MREDIYAPNSTQPSEPVDLKICPKCRFAPPEAHVECGRCGLIYAKYRPRHMDARSVDGGLTLRQRFLPEAPVVSPCTFGGRVVLLLFLLIWGWPFVTHSMESGYAGSSFLHLVNLVFHEAGHVVMGFFGPLIASLGGSLAQVLIPALCLFTLLVKTRDAFGAAVALWWLAENLMDIAPYINDARARTLTLLGGVTGREAAYGYHDWEFILTETGLLQYDHTLACAVHGLGLLLMLTSFAWAVTALGQQWRKLRHQPR